MDEENWTAYVFKQPVTSKKEQACDDAINICPMEAIRDNG